MGFSFLFRCNRKCFVLHIAIQKILMISTSVEEFAELLICHHNIPITYYEVLCHQLKRCIEEAKVSEKDIESERHINFVECIDGVAKSWADLIERSHLTFGKTEPLSNDAIFSDVYHSLIHSHFINTLLELEQDYAIIMFKLLKQRDENIMRIEGQCRKEMEDALLNVGTVYSDNYVNQLAKKHIETTEMEASKWTSEISNLEEKQRRHYRDHIIKLYETLQIEQSSEDKSVKSINLSSQKLPEVLKSTDSWRREESFTVHLGAQMKMSHNLRLISCEVLDLCRHKNSGMLPSLRLQTAISLYSNSLYGLVLLVDNRLNSFSGIKKEFAMVCDQSTDFHFPTLEQQMEQISECLNKAKQLKTKDKFSKDVPEVHKMHAGNFYVTRHSNLSEVHVVYHLVIDETLQGDISSRHPVIIAYRNIIKTSFQSDVSTLTLPLLLVHEMTEEMTIAWCLKRAELVFKCIKGFIMELPHYSFNIQFLVPESLSDETFASLSTMMPSIFRMSNPVVAKS